MRPFSTFKLSLAFTITIIGIVFGSFTLADRTFKQKESCSTYLFEDRDTLLIGHNLDESIDMPGLVIVNPRNISKHSISWDDLNSFFGRSEPKLSWVSKYASMTYNTLGKEFIDGGMNETGFYVGEMNLLGTKYPTDKNLIRLYHHQWMQYLLDNCATVNEALSSLSSIAPEGPCRWHFFFADRNGNAAVVEYLDEKITVISGESLPYKILCNTTYTAELKYLSQFEGFGGNKKTDQRYDKEDPRFRWCSDMLKHYDHSTPMINYAFFILQRLWLNNKWSIVYDLKHARMYFTTYKSRSIRFIDLKQFDTSGDSPAMVLDINRDFVGNVTSQFIPYNEDIQLQYVKQFLDNIDMGFFGNLFFKPKMARRLSLYIKDFKKIQ
jgi:choloylglycine hydrolase